MGKTAVVQHQHDNHRKLGELRVFACQDDRIIVGVSRVAADVPIRRHSESLEAKNSF
jgi:hypothetical protein